MTNDQLEEQIEELESKLSNAEVAIASAKARAYIGLEQILALAYSIQRNQSAGIDKVINDLEHQGVTYPPSH